MRRLWAWLRSPILSPDVIAVPVPSPAADVDAAKLVLLSYLDREADMWPEARNVEGIDLAVDVLLALGVRLGRPAPGEVPVIPGRSS